MTWEQLTIEILDRLDIVEFYRSMGVEIVKNYPNRQGWLRCRGFRSGASPTDSNHDDRPSAVINISDSPRLRGRYKDSATGENLSLFDFAALNAPSVYGRDHLSAKKAFAQRLGIPLPHERNGALNGQMPSGKREQSSPRKPTKKEDPKTPPLRFVRWLDMVASVYCSLKPGIQPQSLTLAGAIRAFYPASSFYPQQVFALPVFSVEGDVPRHSGFVAIATNGGPVRLYSGTDPSGNPVYEYPKCLTIAGTQTGFLNKHALEHWDSAELIWKVEGITDMLSLQSIIPTDLIATHLVVTNPHGTDEKPRPRWSTLFAGKRVALCHDCDIGGQNGAHQWQEFLCRSTDNVRNVVLPFPIAQKHGNDLRDFISAGGTYEQLLALYESSSSSTSQEPEFARAVLEALGIEVLGEYHDETIQIFSRTLKKLSLIDSIGHLNLAALAQKIGQTAIDKVTRLRQAPQGMFTIDQAREAIAVESSTRRLLSRHVLGSGIWAARDGTIVIVNSNSGALYANSEIQLLETPRHQDQVFDFAPSLPWIEMDQLASLIREYQNPTAVANLLAEFSLHLSKWSFTYANDVDLLIGLLAATWVQTLWTWRPLVAITGPTTYGKTTLLDWLVDLFGNNVIHLNRPTEPGVRQQIGHTAKAVFIDELDKTLHRGRILHLLRTSGSGSVIATGTTGEQAGKLFGIRHIVWTAGIESGLVEEADKNRFIVFEIQRPRQRGITLPRGPDAVKLGHSLLAAMLPRIHRAVVLADKLKLTLIENVPNRIVECFSVPAASLAVLTNADPVPLLRRLIDNRYSPIDTIESDSDRLFSDILRTTIDKQGTRYTIGSIVATQRLRALFGSEIESYGIGFVQIRRGPRSYDAANFSGIFIAPTATFARQLVHHPVDLDTILARLPGAYRCQRILSGQRQRGVFIPWLTVSSFLTVPNLEPESSS